MKKILIALDYNASAQKVAAAGYALAQAMDGELALIHVITETAYYALDYSPIMRYEGGYTAGTIAVADDIKKEAHFFLSAIVNQLGNNRIKIKILEGSNTTDAILDFVKDWNADLLVMGSHRHKGIERLLVTDLAVHILKHSKIPLLTIPTDEN